MGKGFGNLAYVSRQIWYTLSPLEQRPFAGQFKVGIPNTIRRTAEEAPYILLPFFIAYGVYKWTITKAHEMSHKASGGGH